MTRSRWGQVSRAVLRGFGSPRRGIGVQYHAGMLNRRGVVRSAQVAILCSAIGRVGIFHTPGHTPADADDTDSRI